MLGMDYFRQTATQLVQGLERNVGEFQAQVEKWLGDTGLIEDTKLSTLSEMSDAYRAMLESLVLQPFRFIGAERELVRQHLALGYYTLMRGIGRDREPVVAPESDDRRFSAEEWDKYLPFDYLKQAYLLNANAFMHWIEQIEGMPDANHNQLQFYARQIISAIAPSNFLLTNPEVLKLTWEKKGSNLIEGARQFWQDLQRNPALFNVGMTDTTMFEVGKNIATAPGKVIFQNDLMQLIQFSPSTETVHQRPLLIIPPWINKYYILDLSERNSFIRWLVDQGMTVFVISWVNPGPTLRDKGFDDYMIEGPLAAIDAIRKATGEDKINAIGYCIGGTLLASTLAWLKKKSAAPIVSATYLTTLLDFSDPGGIGVFINPHMLNALDKMMAKTGYLDGRGMAFSFNLLRENELFWSFWINNYLKGEKPVAFDLLYWNTDSTNLPARMHSYYLRNMYLENKLVKPDALTLAGESIDLSQIDLPAYFLSARQDHIAQWKTTYQGARVHGGDVRFVLSGSGHIAGVVNPPYKNKYGYWTQDKLDSKPDTWFATAQHHSGSWWPHWLEWVTPHAGERVPARIPGDGELPALEDAPGTYVKVRAADAIKAGK